MFAEMMSPDNLLPHDLDDFLAKGWFRMRQTIFTTHFLCFKNQFYSAIWLRVGLVNHTQDTKFGELKKRNRLFTVDIKRAVITRTQEALFTLYRNSVSFELSDNLHQLLHGYESSNRFDTHEVNLYDGTTLIGVGYFDVGKISAAGISSFYHPDYKKYSLGKYLIYLKMEFCRQRQMQYFYPGYVAPGYPLFDYKLSIGKADLQYYSLYNQQWLSYTSTPLTPLQTMQTQLALLQTRLKEKKRSSSILYYRYFDAGLDAYFSGFPLLGFPIFLYYYYATNTAVFRLIVYDVCTGCYQLLECSSISQMEYFENSPAIFSAELLQVDQLLVTAATPEEMVAALL